MMIKHSDFILQLRYIDNKLVDLCGNNIRMYVGNPVPAEFKKFDQGFYLENSVVICDISTPMVISSEFTISLWIKPNSAKFTTYPGVMGFFQSGSLDWGLQLFRTGIKPTSKMFFYINETRIFVSNNVFPIDDKYHHIALTCKSGIIRLFIDGVLEASVSSITQMTPLCNPLIIGGTEAVSGTGTYNCNALYDDVCLLKTCLWETDFTLPKSYLGESYRVIEKDENVYGL